MSTQFVPARNPLVALTQSFLSMQFIQAKSITGNSTSALFSSEDSQSLLQSIINGDAGDTRLGNYTFSLLDYKGDFIRTLQLTDPLFTRGLGVLFQENLEKFTNIKH